MASPALLRAIYDAAVGAAHPDRVVAGALPPVPRGHIVLLAAGKAAAAMAQAAEQHYLDDLGLAPDRMTGLATTRHGHRVPTRCVEVIEAGHPVPDGASVAAAERSLRLAQAAGPGDLLLVLLSGGGSANWIAPPPGVSLAQKQSVNRALLRSGASIHAVNCVRKHLSRIKGGRLARAAGGANVVTLAISDVPQDDPAVIASGPTVPDPGTLADARAIVKRFGIPVGAEIEAALADPANESCKPGDDAFARTSYGILARPQDALEAAKRVAADAGFDVIDLGADIEGEASDVARVHAQLALRAAMEGKRTAILSGGELTVTVRGTGRGGPNQEYALALAAALNGCDGVSILAADTDGADGGGGSASDPAGVIVGASTFAAISDLRLDAEAYLANNDATGFFERTGGLLITGPTLTNVNDIRAILIDPS